MMIVYLFILYISLSLQREPKNLESGIKKFEKRKNNNNDKHHRKTIGDKKRRI